MHCNGGSLEFKSDNWLLCSVYRPRIRPSPLPSGVWSKITAADLAEVLLAATRIERRGPHVVTVPHTDKWEHITYIDDTNTLINRCRHFGVKQRSRFSSENPLSVNVSFQYDFAASHWPLHCSSCLWLAESDHMTWILGADWLIESQTRALVICWLL